MKCYVCGSETPFRQRYCDQCRVFLKGGHELLKRRMALKEAYDKDCDGFRCHWSGVILEERDLNDPYHLCFDHFYPVKTSILVTSAVIFNQMKAELGPDEFPRAIKVLAAHHEGQPFDRDAIEFKYWKRKSPSPPEPGRRLRRGELTKVLVSECVICGRPPVRWSIYCPHCRRFVLWQGRDCRMHAEAMKKAWCADEDGFLCHFTGVRLDDSDPTNPWFLTFDHSIPGDKDTIVVAAAWVNKMKTSLSEAEFWKMITEYDRYLRKDGEFDKDVVEFKYWRKTRRYGRSYEI